MKTKGLYLRQAVVSVMMMMAMLWQGSAVAVAGEYNPYYAWATDYIPTESPKTMEEIVEILKKNPTVVSTPVLAKGSGSTQGVDTLTFYMYQALDYKQTDESKPNRKQQRVTIINFAGADKPTVLHTNGYSTSEMGLFHCDLAKALGANMIEVEHRYFDLSIPDYSCFEKHGGFLNNQNYFDYNTAEQQATDIAFVVNTLKKLKIFTGKWVASGVSKSGMTTAFLAMYHPETCDVYVPFCAPFCQTLGENLGYWADGKGYGELLKATNEEDYKKWQTTWDRVLNFEKNATLRKEVLKRYRAHLDIVEPGNTYTDDALLVGIYRNYAGEMFPKASYLRIDDWYFMTPSAVGPNDNVSEAYCDSMYNFLTIPYDSLSKIVDKRKEQLVSSKRGADMIHRHYDIDRTYNMLNRAYQRRAADPYTGLDSAILSLSPYQVETLYELGNYVSDYGMVKEKLDVYGEGYTDKIRDEGLIFRYPIYKPIVEHLELNTTTPPYLPKDPIAPKVKNFVKTTDAKIVFVYGGYDPWTKAGITDEDIPAGHTNIARFLVPSGVHDDYVLSSTYSSDATIGKKIVDKVKEMLGQTTGIETIETKNISTPNSDVMYNLSGQKVDSSYKGIVIKNGKKIKL